MTLYRKNDIKRKRKLDKDYRTDFRRDYARLIHSPAFRRLQGKKQLFPGYESDYFRNRLTHSLEVAQIAKSIALKLNIMSDYFINNPIDTDLVEFAGLAHDLGHPPFGHNGEYALNEIMSEDSFEGNAQTLRILAKIEKKEFSTGADKHGIKNGLDERIGLNLTFRTLASILKYDEKLPNQNNKGYYKTEQDIVSEIKKNVCGKIISSPFKTIECQIMDIADDIAYSTYDLEDYLKAGFLNPFDILSIEDEIFEKIANDTNIEKRNVRTVIQELFFDCFKKAMNVKKNEWGIYDLFIFAKNVYNQTKCIAQNGYYRINFTSLLVNEFIEGIEINKINYTTPALSKIQFTKKIKEKVNVLKSLTYNIMINSSLLKISEYRGKQIVKSIFEAINSDPRLLPEDFRYLYTTLKNENDKKRTICDFISGMTDRYALEYYGRLKSEKPESIYKKL